MGLKEFTKDAIEDLLSTTPEDREQWGELYISKLGSRKMKIPSEASIISKIVATPIALASIYGSDLIDWTKFIGDALHGKSNPSLEDITLWSMGALGGGTTFGAKVPKGALREGMSWEEKVAKLGEPAENKALNEFEELLGKQQVARTPESMAKELGLTYQGEWEGFGVMEFRDELTKGNLTVKSLDDLEERVLELRKLFKENPPSMEGIL